MNRMKPAYLRDEIQAELNEEHVDLSDTELGQEPGSTTQDEQYPRRKTNNAQNSQNTTLESENSSRSKEKKCDEEVDSDDTFYEIEKVIRGRYHEGNLQYLIKWKGFSPKFNTWEPECALNDEARDYLSKHPVKITGKKV